jgi:hypothetical protein
MRANVLELGGGGSVSAIEEEGAWGRLIRSSSVEQTREATLPDLPIFFFFVFTHKFPVTAAAKNNSSSSSSYSPPPFHKPTSMNSLKEKHRTFPAVSASQSFALLSSPPPLPILITPRSPALLLFYTLSLSISGRTPQNQVRQQQTKAKRRPLSHKSYTKNLFTKIK